MHTSDHGRGSRRAVRVASIAIVGGLVLALFVGGCGDSSGDDALINVQAAGAVAAVDTITVQGKATVSGTPDQAVLTLAVESEGSDPAASMNTNSVALNKVLDRLKAEGVDSAAIETTQVTVFPVRTYNPQTGEETLTGYRSQNTVSVTLTDFSMVGTVLAAALESGVTNVSGPVWKLKDDTTTVVKALTDAVANARTKAQALADAQGVKLGDVIMMSEGNVGQPIDPLYGGYYETAGAAFDKYSPTPITPAQLDVVATITVTYSLKR